MVTRKSAASVDQLNRLEAKANSLKVNLQVYRQQLDQLLQQAKKEFGLTTPESVAAETKSIAKQLTELQSQRDAANKQALQLLAKME